MNATIRATNAPETTLPADLIDPDALIATESGATPADDDPLLHGTELHDARVSGPDSPEWQALLARQVTFLLPEDRNRDAKQTRWKNKTATFRDWLSSAQSALTHHVERRRKGYFPIVWGKAAGTARVAKDMVTVDAVALDVDSGESYAVALDRVEKLGLACIAYTSFSDGTTTSYVERDRVLKDLGDAALSDESLRDWLTSKGRHTPEHVASVTISDHGVHREGGVMIELSHAPLEKFRLVFPLELTVTVAKLAGTHRECLTTFERKLRGLAKLIELRVDESCFDVCRAFFLPSRPKGGDFALDVIRGRGLDFASLAETANAKSTWEQAGKGAERGPQMPSGMSLKAWAAKYAKRFELARLMQELAPDKVRKTSGVTVVECPFDEGHSNAGDPDDTACHVRDGDGEAGFSWSCKHDSCSGHDRLDMLAKALADDWFDESCITDRDFLVTNDEDLEAEEDEEEDESDVIEDGKVTAAALRKRFRKLVRSDAESLDAIRDGAKDSGFTETQVRKLWTEAARDVALAEIRDNAEKRKSATPPDYVILEEATAATVAKAAKNATWLPEFARYKNGWFETRPLDKPEAGYKPLCRAFEVPFIAFGETGEGRTTEITIRYLHRSAQRGIVETIYRIGDTYKESGSFLSRLADEGLEIDGMADVAALVRLFRSVNTSREAVLVEKAGWYGDTYVAPTGEVVNAGAQRFILNPTVKVAARSQGTLAGHYTAATTALTGANGRYFLPGYLSGLVGCLVDYIANETSPVLALEGQSTRGKSTSGKAGAGHWTIPDDTGLFRKADTTANAAENLVVKGNAAVLVLDEEGSSKITAEEKQRLILQHADGSGRARATADGGTRETKTWRTCIVTSAEVGFTNRMAAEDTDIKTGAVARVFSVSFDGAAELDADSDELKAVRVLSNHQDTGVYGVSGVVFAERLAGLGRDVVRARVSEAEEEWSDLAKGAGTRVVRIAAIFTVAGEIAQEAGLFGSEVKVREMMRGLLVETLAARTVHLDTDRQVTENLRRAILHGIRTGTILSVHDDLVPNRADVLGYFGHLAENGRPDHARADLLGKDIAKAHRTGKGGEELEADERGARVYILPLDRLAKLTTSDQKSLIDRLAKIGALVERSKGKRTQRWHDYLPGEGAFRNIRVTGAFVHGDEEGGW